MTTANRAAPAELDGVHRTITDAEALSDEALVQLQVGVRTVIEHRNRADEAPDDTADPWRTLRRHVVGQHAGVVPSLALAWIALPASYGGGAIEQRRGCVPTIYIDTALPYGKVSETLVHELVHWERGIQAVSVTGWERAEEERVVSAITADRIRAAQDALAGAVR